MKHYLNKYWPRIGRAEMESILAAMDQAPAPLVRHGTPMRVGKCECGRTIVEDHLDRCTMCMAKRAVMLRREPKA